MAASQTFLRNKQRLNLQLLQYNLNRLSLPQKRNLNPKTESR
jgi:hypothetical protein